MSNKVVFSNAELYEKVEPGTLSSLIIEGYWDNPQFTGNDVDTTGLTFKAVYDNRCVQVISPVISPSSWSIIPGEQTATFSYTEDGITVSASKTASIRNRNSVGGIIFYIDDTAGGKFIFYDSNGNHVDEPTVGIDCTGWTYITVEHGSKDKFYVFNNVIKSPFSWGIRDGNLIGATGTAVGTGKTNTALVIGSSSDVSGSIWQYIRNMRTNMVGGCDDWYVGSKDELDKLRDSGLVDWFTNRTIWSSSEINKDNAWDWIGSRSQWSNWNWKTDWFYNGYGIRSF